MSRNSRSLPGTQTTYPVISSDTSSLSMANTCLFKLRTSSSNSSSISGRSKSLKFVVDGDDFGFYIKLDGFKDGRSGFEDGDDPFAFDEEELQLLRWDMLSQKNKVKKTQNGKKPLKKVEEKIQPEHIKNPQDSVNDDFNGSQSSFYVKLDKERSNFIAECLLSAIKVLMNLSNENPVGCWQIAAHGELESLSSLIAGHFPVFNPPCHPYQSLSLKDHQNRKHRKDQEIDFLVAILGLLVNLVEKDSQNRTRLASTTIPMPASNEMGERFPKDVIPLLCSIFLANQMTWNDEAALVQGEKEAEKNQKMIIEAY